MISRVTQEARLDRVRRIADWDADREAQTVWIMGQSGLRGQGDLVSSLAIAAAGVGARRIIISGQVERFGLPLERWLDDVEIALRPRGYSAKALRLVLNTLGVDLFLDATGCDPLSVRIAHRLGIPAYSCGAVGNQLSFAAASAKGSVIPSGPASMECCLALAGLVTHYFALRVVLGRDRASVPANALHLNLSHPWGIAEELAELPSARWTKPLTILLVGAGGLGCAAGPILALRLAKGSRVIVADDDTVEATNRNRQFLYSQSDAVAEEAKATALCRELRRLRPDVEWTAVGRKFPHRDIKKHGPFDVVLSFTDTFRSRQKIAESNIAPILVNAAVDEEAASAALFHDGSVPMAKALGLHQLSQGEGRTRASCPHAAPSIISTNLVGASLALSLLSRHLKSGPQPARLLTYDPGSAVGGGAWPPFV